MAKVKKVTKSVTKKKVSGEKRGVAAFKAQQEAKAALAKGSE